MKRGTTERASERHKTRLISPITRRILTVNILALAILAAGILYLGEYKDNLIDGELSALATQAEMFAVALSEGAVAETSGGQYRVSEISNQMVRRLVETTGTRARLFKRNGQLAADSRLLAGSKAAIRIEELPPPEQSRDPFRDVLEAFDRVLRHLVSSRRLSHYEEKARPHARDYPEVVAALNGDYVKALRAGDGESLVLSVAVPVQRYKQVLGALMLTKGSERIDAAMFEVRRDILKVFAVVLSVTVLISGYLAGTIARPLRRLAAAAERVRHDHGRHHRIPDMSDRRDEIGELAETLSQMMEALWQRMDAIESFAADVAHEIKNPLTSLRSAVETASRLKDPDQQKKLMTIIAEDVTRLDRLISDISDASRLDAELSRAEAEKVDIGAMLAMLADVQNTTRDGGPEIRLERSDGGERPVIVDGIESRIAQVFRNLISNAVSFNPPDGRITVSVSRDKGYVRVDIDDEGPGIPAGAEENIFKRFYTERPKTEKFGTHSGLGLNISKQIVEAHFGTLTGANRVDFDNRIAGARFTVRLPETNA